MPSDAAASAAKRQPAAVAIPAMHTGAAAQPMLPATPCAEKACASLAGETLRLRTVKSAGWNTAFPAPASTAAASRVG